MIQAQVTNHGQTDRQTDIRETSQKQSVPNTHCVNIKNKFRHKTSNLNGVRMRENHRKRDTLCVTVCPIIITFFFHLGDKVT